MRKIIPRKIKGFRDSGPGLNALKWHIINSAGKVYKLYGFEHWDTPVMEYADCIGKYLPEADSVDEGIYFFRNPEKENLFDDEGELLRDSAGNFLLDNHFVALRYDLTAPLSRLYAEQLWDTYKRGQLTNNNAPLLRRYQYGPVFRYEAKLDPGRFREFWQLDFDSVGSADMGVDAEVCMVLSDALEAIGLPRGSFKVKVNNRKIFKGYLSNLGITNEESEQAVLRIMDKVDKIGKEGMVLELGRGRKDKSGAEIKGLGLDESLVSKIVGYLDDFSHDASRKDVIASLQSLSGGNAVLDEGIAELSEIDGMLSGLGFDEERVAFSPALVRGMSYYTGPIFEVESSLTFKDDKGNERRVGAICGGGRYDGLVERLLGAKVPATGASIGVDRLAELLTLTGLIPQSQQGPVLIISFDNSLKSEYMKIASELRAEGISSEIYFGLQKGLKKQMAYGDKKNSPLVVIIGSDEHAKGVATLRDMRMGAAASADAASKEEWKHKAQIEVPRAQIAEKVKEMLSK